MIDTHAHLVDEKQTDVDKIIKKAVGVGVKKIVLAGSNIEDSVKNVLLTEKYKGILYPAVGIHPQEKISEDSQIDRWLKKLEKLIKENEVIAIGECGLDYSQLNENDRQIKINRQEKLFRNQICLSLKYKLPLIIHARKAVDETVEILSQYKKTQGVFHCYAGGKKRIKKVDSLGKNWYFGFDGNLTYEVGLEEAVKMVNKNRLLLETDSPFLTPIPYRGEKNQPAYVKYVYEKVARIWEMKVSEVEKIVDKNAAKLMGLV